MSTTEEMINKMYDSQLTSQKEQLGTDYAAADARLTEQKEKNQKATDANIHRTNVAAQKAAVSDAEYYAASGLTSGAKAQARIARENQLQSDLTAIRTAQQEADAQVERERSLLAKDYAAAIRQAQAQNDLQKAQALYEQAQKDDAALLAKQEAAAGIMAEAGDFSRYGALYGLSDAEITSLKSRYNATGTQNEYALEAAKLMAEAGDYSRIAELYGLTTEEYMLLMGITPTPSPGKPAGLVQTPVPVTTQNTNTSITQKKGLLDDKFVKQRG